MSLWPQAGCIQVVLQKHTFFKFAQTLEFSGATEEGGQGSCSSVGRIARAAPSSAEAGTCIQQGTAGRV